MKPTIFTQFLFPTLALAVVLAGCDGAAQVSFDAPTTQASIYENSTSVLSVGQAHVSGTNSNGIKYSLTGTDAALLTVNETTGAIVFKRPADFEYPQDADKNNEYLVEVSARVKDSFATQTLRINVKDETRPALTVIQPKPYENVGDGTSTNVTSLVQFFDEESNGPIKTGKVTLNGIPLAQDTQNPLLWRASIKVPEEGLTAEITATTTDNKTLKSSAQWLNKRYALKPFLMGPSLTNSLFIYDPVKRYIAVLNLASNNWNVYFSDPRLTATEFVLDFNPENQSIYFFMDLNTYKAGDLLLSLNFLSTPVTQFAGYIPGALSITWDKPNRRAIVLTQIVENSLAQYRVLAVGEESFLYRGIPGAAPSKLLLTLPVGAIEGKFKYFSYHRASKTYLVASERDYKSGKKTVIKAYSEAGQEQFEAAVGPDISNLAIDESRGLVYLAENHSTVLAKLKTINIKTGDVADFGENRGVNAVGAYSDIRLDFKNTVMYVGDTVSDSIFVIDLATQAMRQIPAVYAGDAEDN